MDVAKLVLENQSYREKVRDLEARCNSLKSDCDTAQQTARTIELQSVALKQERDALQQEVNSLKANQFTLTEFINERLITKELDQGTCNNCAKAKVDFDRELEGMALSAQKEITDCKAALSQRAIEVAALKKQITILEEQLNHAKMTLANEREASNKTFSRLQAQALVLKSATGAASGVPGISQQMAASVPPSALKQSAQCPFTGAQQPQPHGASALQTNVATVPPFRPTMSDVAAIDKIMANEDMQLDEDERRGPRQQQPRPVKEDPEVITIDDDSSSEQEAGAIGSLETTETIRYFSAEILADKYPFLPLDWAEHIHASGIPYYVHQPSGVRTFSRPFHPRSFPKAKENSIPLVSIPCFYWRVIQNWGRMAPPNEAEDVYRTNDQKSVVRIPPENKPGYRSSDWVTGGQLRDYVAEHYEFRPLGYDWKTDSNLSVECRNHQLVPINRFRTIRTFQRKQQRALYEVKNDASLKVSNVEIPGTRDLVPLSFVTADPVALLDQLIKERPEVFERIISLSKNEFLPIQVSVHLKPTNAVFSSYGTDEPHALHLAASALLSHLVPGFKPKPLIRTGPVGVAPAPDEYLLFDKMPADDAQVTFQTERSGLPESRKKFSPLVILAEFMMAHYQELDEWQFAHECRDTPFGPEHGWSRLSYWMKLGAIEVLLPCADRQTGKIRAAQALLTKFHPNLTSWGAICRKYLPPPKDIDERNVKKPKATASKSSSKPGASGSSASSAKDGKEKDAKRASDGSSAPRRQLSPRSEREREMAERARERERRHEEARRNDRKSDGSSSKSKDRKRRSQSPAYRVKASSDKDKSGKDKGSGRDKGLGGSASGATKVKGMAASAAEGKEALEGRQRKSRSRSPAGVTGQQPTRASGGGGLPEDYRWRPSDEDLLLPALNQSTSWNASPSGQPLSLFPAFGAGVGGQQPFPGAPPPARFASSFGSPTLASSQRPLGEPFFRPGFNRY